MKSLVLRIFIASDTTHILERLRGHEYLSTAHIYLLEQY
jgi:hypothetical protein